jgi:hypothetical protein
MVEESTPPGRPPEPTGRPASLLGGERFRLSIGRVLARAIQAWFRILAPYSLLALLLSVPLFFPMLALATAAQEPGEDPHQTAAGWAAMLTGVLLGAGLVHTVLRHQQGEPVGFGEALLVGLRRLVPTVIVYLVSFLLAAMWFLTGLLGDFGYVLALGPFLVTLCALFVSVPVCVAERGVAEAVRRSLHLTRRNLGPIFALLFVYNVLNVSTTLLANVLMEVAGATTSVRLFVGGFLSILAFGLLAALQAVTYHELRTGKEGVDVSKLAAVFE